MKERWNAEKSFRAVRITLNPSARSFLFSLFFLRLSGAINNIMNRHEIESANENVKNMRSFSHKRFRLMRIIFRHGRNEKKEKQLTFLEVLY